LKEELRENCGRTAGELRANCGGTQKENGFSEQTNTKKNQNTTPTRNSMTSFDIEIR